MDRAEEKAGPKDVGEQALMRGFEQSVGISPCHELSDRRLRDEKRRTYVDKGVIHARYAHFGDVLAGPSFQEVGACG